MPSIERLKILWYLETELGVRCLAHFFFFLLFSLDPLWSLAWCKNGKVIMPHVAWISPYSESIFYVRQIFQKHSLCDVIHLFKNIQWLPSPPGLSTQSSACQFFYQWFLCLTSFFSSFQYIFLYIILWTAIRQGSSMQQWTINPWLWSSSSASCPSSNICSFSYTLRVLSLYIVYYSTVSVGRVFRRVLARFSA